ncbi:MAG: hypothetical protein QW566_03795, partial [Candidatus Jordarchaeales archaeon]
MSRTKSIFWFLAVLLIVTGLPVQRVIAPGVPFNVYGYVKDDLGNAIAGASVTVRSPIDQASTSTDSQGRYAVTLSVNGPGDQIQVTATYGSRSGSASGSVPSGQSSMQIDVTVPRASTSISCSASPSTVIIGGSVTVSGAISPAVGGATVTLTYTKPDSSTFTRSVTTTSSGSYSDTYTPDQLGAYSVQASWEGNNDYKGAASGKAFFTVTKKPSSISVSLSPGSIVAGEKIDVSGAISPPIAGASVTISYRPSGGTWSTIATVSTDSEGRYSYSWTGTPSSTGTYELMASWPGNNEYEGASSTASFTVVTPDFSLTLDRKNVRLTIGQNRENVTVRLKSIGGFSSTISLSLENVPSGLQATLLKNSLTLPPNGEASTILTLYATWNTAPGEYSFKIKASGGGLTHEDTVSVSIVLPSPSFSIVIEPGSITLPVIEGYNSTVEVKIVSNTNYSINVNLNIGGPPNGVEATLKDNSLRVEKMSTGSTLLTLTVVKPLPAKGEYVITIMGSCSSVIASSTLNLGVIEKTPSRIEASLNATSLEYGESVEVSGTIIPAPGEPAPVSISLVLENKTRVKIGEANADAQGRFRLVFTPTEVGSCKIVSEWRGTGLYLGSSSEREVRITRAKTLVTSKTNATQTFAGKTVLVSGKLTTEEGKPIGGVNISIAFSRKGLSLYAFAETNSAGDYSLPLNLAEGEYEVRVAFLGNKYYEPSYAEAISLSVTKEPESLITA